MSTQREQQSPIARPGLKLRAKARLGLLSDLRLVAYLSHGTREFLHVKGRLVEAPGLSGSIGKDGSLLSNVLTTLHRIGSEEIPGARLVATFDGRDHDAYTDNEGYFHVNLYPREPLTVGWHDVHVELAESVKEAARTSATARVLVPPEENAFAVVSDLDDTVIQTSATDKLEMIRLTLFENAATRIAFPGIASLYVALTRGADRNGQNPIFYVSRSGWNLYDLFIEFFERNGIPPGPLFLRDLSFWEDKSTALGSVHHKLAQIRELLRAYPRLPFVLIGDSGQGDADTYRQIVLENPGRVRAVYLRDVTTRRRNRKVRAIAEDLQQRGVPALLAQHSEEFAAHMRSQGLIGSAA